MSEKQFPPCFSSRVDYERWLDSEQHEKLAAQHCHDCLPSFKRRMERLGRCEHPETRFLFKYEDGFEPDDIGLSIIGTWREAPQAKGVRALAIKKPPEPKPDYWQEQDRLTRERIAL